ncbi:MAG: hypothetical protein KIS78_02460 [Labilithrix sp.]|nr:hypothetical protein [Labilithrix sp.]
MASDDAVLAIEAYPWPGNVRALENAIEPRRVLLRAARSSRPRTPFGRVARALQKPTPAPAPERAAARRRAVGPSLDVQRELLRALPRSPRATARTQFLLAVALALLARGAAAGVVSASVVDATASSPVDQHRGERRAARLDPRFRVLPDTGVDLFNAIDSYQNNLIRQALTRTAGNRNRAAQLLGLNRTTLVEMIRRRGL